MISAIGGIFSGYKKLRKEFFLVLTDIPGHISKQQVLPCYWSKGGFLTPSFKNDATVSSSSEEGSDPCVLTCDEKADRKEIWLLGADIRDRPQNGTDQVPRLLWTLWFFHRQVRASPQAFLGASFGCEKQDGNSRSLPRKGHTNTCKDWGDEKAVQTDCRCCKLPYVQKLLPGCWLEKLSFHTPQRASTAEFHTNFPRLLARHPDYAGKMFTVKSTCAKSRASMRKSLV